MSATARKIEEPDFALNRALDAIENLATIQRTMLTLLSATMNDAPQDVRGDLACTLYNLRTLESDGTIDKDTVRGARLAVEDSLTPCDDMNIVDRAGMAAMFGLTAAALEDIATRLRPQNVEAPRAKRRQPTRGDGVIVGLFADNDGGNY